MKNNKNDITLFVIFVFLKLLGLIDCSWWSLLLISYIVYVW